MAKVKFTAVVADMRNKLNGTVFSKNRAGAYTRTKVTPVNRQTNYQATVRNRLSTYAQGWRALTATQLAAWNAAVDSFKSTDIFGDIKTPSGINLYVKLNTNLAMVNASAITTPPLPTAITAITALSAAAAAGTPAFTVTFAPTPVPTGYAFVIMATKQLSPGKSFFGGQYIVLSVVDAAGTSPSNILSAYTARFGTLVAGQKVGIKIMAVNKTTGQSGVPLSTTVTIAA